MGVRFDHLPLRVNLKGWPGLYHFALYQRQFGWDSFLLISLAIKIAKDSVASNIDLVKLAASGFSNGDEGDATVTRYRGNIYTIGGFLASDIRQIMIRKYGLFDLELVTPVVKGLLEDLFEQIEIVRSSGEEEEFPEDIEITSSEYILLDEVEIVLALLCGEDDEAKADFIEYVIDTAYEGVFGNKEIALETLEGGALTLYCQEAVSIEARHNAKLWRLAYRYELEPEVFLNDIIKGAWNQHPMSKRIIVAIPKDDDEEEESLDP